MMASEREYTPKVVPWLHRSLGFLRTPDERIVLEGLSGGGGMFTTVHLMAMVQDTEYVERFTAAYERITTERGTDV